MEEWGLELVAEISGAECNYEKVKSLLERGVDPCAVYGDRGSAIFLSVERNDQDLLSVLLAQASAEGLQRTNDEGLTPLMLASKLGYVECASILVGSLLSRSPDAINATSANGRGDTALHLACSEGHDGVAAVLLGAGADPNAKDGKGRRPAHVCAVRGNLQLLARLRRSGAELDARDDQGNTPMHFCAHVPVLRYLHSEGLDPAVKNNQGSTPCDILERLQVNEAVIESLRTLQSHSDRQGLVNSARQLLRTIANDLGWKGVVFILIVFAVVSWQVAVYLQGSPFLNLKHKRLGA